MIPAACQRWGRGCGARIQRTGDLFSYVDIEARVPARHPLRAIRSIVNDGPGEPGCGVREDLRRDRAAVDCTRAAAAGGSAAGVLLDPLGAAVDGAARLQPALPLVRRAGRGRAGVGPPVFSKNRDRLLEADVAAKFLGAVLANPQVKPLLSDEHFSVDGTQIEAWASMKSFRAKDGSTSRRRRAAMASAISTTRSAATRRMPPPRTPRPSSTRRAKARRPSCASWGTR